MFFRKQCPIELFRWTKRMQFWNPRWDFLDRRPGIFCSVSKIDKRTSFFRLFSIKRMLWTCECRFDNITEFFPTKGQKKSLKIQKSWKIQSFQKQLFFIEMFLGTSRLQFPQFRQNVFYKTFKTFCPLSEKDIKIYLSEKIFFSCKYFYGHAEGRFEIPHEKFPP